MYGVKFKGFQRYVEKIFKFFKSLRNVMFRVIWLYYKINFYEVFVGNEIQGLYVFCQGG